MTPELVRVPGGRIAMRDEGTRREWEVVLQPFEIGVHAVTRAEYREVVGKVPESTAGPRTPVTDVSWIDAVRFCNRLSERAGLRSCYSLQDEVDALDARFDEDADGFRLPREAEWEHACRAGSSDVRYGPLDDIAWHRGNAGGAIHEVATRRPNVWGLHDTIGNAWEWCWDVFDAEVYGPYRVFRGGGWCDVPRSCRASCRRKSHPTFRIDDLGFRLVRSA